MAHAATKRHDQRLQLAQQRGSLPADLSDACWKNRLSYRVITVQRSPIDRGASHPSRAFQRKSLITQSAAGQVSET